MTARPLPALRVWHEGCSARADEPSPRHCDAEAGDWRFSIDDSPCTCETGCWFRGGDWGDTRCVLEGQCMPIDPADGVGGRRCVDGQVVSTCGDGVCDPCDERGCDEDCAEQSGG